ncbi:MAG: DUF2256 domain-containing protein [Methylococcus sp.]
MTDPWSRHERAVTHHRKADLPFKVCAVCGRPFAWRKKWATVWEQVRYCSERCRRSRQATPTPHALKR